jgi:hypothetical protein
MSRLAKLMIAGTALGLAMTPAGAHTQAQPAIQPPTIYLSLMGEPFRGPEGGPTALSEWFAGADGDHDGAITLAEMQRDAARFFATLDLNKDGAIDFDELGHYETVVAPARLRFEGGLRPIVSTDRDDNRGVYQPRNDKHGWGGRGSRGDLQYLEVPEPVLMADEDFNRHVTPEEFAKAAAQRFEDADKNRDGRLELTELMPPDPRAKGK